MIEQQIVDGQQATVAYLNDDFELVDKAAATLIKVRFESGRVLFLIPEAIVESDE